MNRFIAWQQTFFSEKRKWTIILVIASSWKELELEVGTITKKCISKRISTNSQGYEVGALQGRNNNLKRWETRGSIFFLTLNNLLSFFPVKLVVNSSLTSYYAYNGNYRGRGALFHV